MLREALTHMLEVQLEILTPLFQNGNLVINVTVERRAIPTTLLHLTCCLLHLSDLVLHRKELPIRSHDALLQAKNVLLVCVKLPANL